MMPSIVSQSRRAHRIEKPRRLISCMQWAALLSVSEAAAALRDWRDGFISSGEAVNHYGGINAVLQAAIHSRDVARQFAFYNAPLESDS